jgi:uncharacterized protein YdaU (DUF1376 family)
MHYYQFNIGDYAKSTLHLSLMEDLAYRRLLDRYYDTEKPLEADVDKLCRFVRLGSHKKETQQVLEEFFSLTQKGWIQKRVAKELGAYSAKADASRANGKKGGRPKKTQQVNSANLDLTQEKAKQEPLNIKQEPLNNNHKELKDLSADKSTDVFSHWKKVMGKNNSSKFNAKRKAAVKSRLKEGYTAEQIIQAIDGCAVTPHNMGQNDRGELFNDLELICRNGSNVERFAGNLSKVIPNQPDYSNVVEQVTLMQEQTQTNQPLLIEDF